MQVECKYAFRELVYVDFEDHKIIGEIQSHRITERGMVLYNVALVNMYCPSSMIYKLTEEQEKKYHEFMMENAGGGDKEEFIQKMQTIFE